VAGVWLLFFILFPCGFSVRELLSEVSSQMKKIPFLSGLANECKHV
jgi:hypothetical protein